MLELHTTLTKNCNVKCRHCHISGGPKNEKYTMTQENFERVIKNIGNEDRINFSFTGGEIFTVKDNLYGCLEVINTKRSKEIKKRNDKIYLQTNGSWMFRKDANQIAKKLEENNVFWIYFNSQDCYFHREQGLKKISYDLAEKIIPRNIMYSMRDCERTKENPRVIPLGRGGQFKDEYSSCEGKCAFNFKRKIFTMDWNGDVAICALGLFKIGNLIEEPLEEIIERNKKSKFIKLLYEDPKSIGKKYLGIKDFEIDGFLEQYGTGGFYAYLHNEKLIPHEHRRIFETK